MKLRRSLALAAATAAIAPVVLLAAPVAYASDDNSASPTVTETTPTDEESTPAADDTTPATDETTPAGEESTPATGDTPGTGTSSPTASGTATPSASASISASPSTSGSPSTSPSASASPSGFPTECADSDEPKTDNDLHTTLSGLPSKIVAGSGFHGFELNVSNSGPHAYQRVDLGVFTAQMDEKNYFVDTTHLVLQYKDPSSRKWVDISLDENDEGAGYLGYTDVKAKESFSIDLRLAVDKTAPAGLGYAISIGMYADDAGNCVFSGDDSFYEFDILKAGSAPSEPGDAKPQGGNKPLPRKPAGDNKIEPQGHLAQTGSNSALPAIALTGGAAVAVGAGAVFLVRRRRASGSGTAA
ncbi:LAETG motif-containing sortase-dependent surface protein [Streptomyces sp. NPDC058294]|uniref:LAETG motif-containing sortase-dependent surface protein n=1 Tax=Streptomyces sp. NPDC058294 TaxID=3346430 RepID=UPI0036E39FD2